MQEAPKPRSVMPRRIDIRVTAEERVRIKSSARLAGLGMSEFLRKCALGKQVLAVSDLTTIRELRRLGGLQVKLHNKLVQQPELRNECARVTQALRSAIDRLAR